MSGKGRSDCLPKSCGRRTSLLLAEACSRRGHTESWQMFINDVGTYFFCISGVWIVQTNQDFSYIIICVCL